MKKSEGVSAGYVLPKSYAPEAPAVLAGGFIWIVLRGIRGDALFAQIYVEMVEQFEDGFNAGDFLLTTNLAKSYRCSTTYESGLINFPVRETTSLPLGLNEIEEGTFEGLSSHARRATAIKLQKPSVTTLGRIDLPLFQGISAITAEAVIAATTRHLPLEEIWASNKPKLPPFANFAYYALLATCGDDIAESLQKKLSVSDPTIATIDASRNIDSPCGQGQSPVVDINLLPIDPDRIYARKFVARCQNPIDLADIAEKTEHAEKRHQDMLRDIVIRLKNLGFSPLQSSSIDLFVAAKSTFFLFELKSATAQNIMSQAAKGAFQLGCYMNALVGERCSSGKLVLVLETTGVPRLDSYVFDVLRTLGLSALFYDISKPWPNRLAGLENLVGR